MNFKKIIIACTIGSVLEVGLLITGLWFFSWSPQCKIRAPWILPNQPYYSLQYALTRKKLSLTVKVQKPEYVYAIEVGRWQPGYWPEPGRSCLLLDAFTPEDKRYRQVINPLGTTSFVLKPNEYIIRLVLSSKGFASIGHDPSLELNCNPKPVRLTRDIEITLPLFYCRWPTEP